MSKIKTKKLLLQNAYLQLDKKETKEKCNAADIEIKEYLQKHFPEDYKLVFENTTKPESESSKQDVSEEASPKQKNKDLKKLYRKIAEKTHPDKTDDADMSEVFKMAASAYSDGDLAMILEIAGNLNIELLELSKESIILLENNIEKISKEINIMKNTIGWNWTQTTNDEERRFLINQIINFHKEQQ
jgi:hypothetical protein